MAVLTVVTVVRNDAEGLRRTLRSIAMQTDPPGELVVHDGSEDQDAVPTVIAEFPQLTVAYSWAPPRGVYPAMNEALGRATGDYVYYLNAGDEFAGPDVVRLLGDALDRGPLWCVGRVDFVAEDGSVISEPPWSYPEERARLFARGRFPAHQAVVVRTSTLRQVGGFDTSYRIAADYASALRLSLLADPVELGFTIARFAVGGLSTTHWRRSLSEFHRARMQVYRPTGLARWEEGARTFERWASTTAYRTLAAPGRPLHGWVGRTGRTQGATPAGG